MCGYVAGAVTNVLPAVPKEVNGAFGYEANADECENAKNATNKCYYRPVNEVT